MKCLWDSGQVKARKCSWPLVGYIEKYWDTSVL